MLTQKRLNELFQYNPVTGIVTRKITTSPNAIAGDAVGHNSKGYLHVSIKKRPYKLHRIIWLMMHGWLPEQIDHINHIRDDNRICNLTATTHRGNCLNHTRPSNNTSGTVGVTWNAATNKWRAAIMVHQKAIYLGTFKRKYKAIAVRKAAEVMYNFHPNHGK